MLWGNEQEKATPTEVAQRSGARLAPFMEFSDLIFFIARARLVISGDTLALHLADLTRTPAVGVFGPSSPERNGPLLPGQPGRLPPAGLQFLLPAQVWYNGLPARHCDRRYHPGGTKDRCATRPKL